MSVGQDDDLPVVADFEEFFHPAVHVADDRLAFDDALAVEGEPQSKDSVGGGMLWADIEHHVGCCETASQCGGDLNHRTCPRAVPSALVVRIASGAQTLAGQIA